MTKKNYRNTNLNDTQPNDNKLEIINFKKSKKIEN